MRFTDPFGNLYPLKSLLITVIGLFSYYRLNIVNRLKVKGGKNLKKLPKQNVLFVSNHQTYFADVMAINQIFSASKWGMRQTVNFPFYLLLPKLRSFYVAAEETMKEGGLLPKIFALGGAVTVKRTWKSKGQEVNRTVDAKDQDKIGMALEHGWLITFPQGTTRPFAPGRKGTAHIIKQNRPLVVPIKVDGFRRAFDKKGLKFKKRGVKLKVEFAPPLDIDYDAEPEAILDQVMEAIGQAEGPWFENGQDK